MKIPKYIRNIGKHWSPTEEKKLGQLTKQNTPIELTLRDRTRMSIFSLRRSIV